MNAVAIALSVGAYVVVMATWVAYMAKVPSGRVPVWPMGSIIAQCTGIALAVSALVVGYEGSGSLGVTIVVPAGFALLMGPMFLWLLTQRKTPIGNLKVAVGDKLLGFEAMTSEGVSFHSDELAGKRTLLKFFRGGW